VGFSVAAAAAIVFTGAVISFAILQGSLQSASDQVQEAQESQVSHQQDLLNTRISLLNGTANGTVFDLNLTNAGSTVIHKGSIDLVINGTLVTANITNATVDGVAASNLWAPGQTLRLIGTSLVVGPADIKLVTDNGYEFYGQVS